jgi:multicomponent Na+:H+ antiporter subunit E
MNDRLEYRLLVPRTRARRAYYSVSALAFLYLFWVLLSGQFEPFLLAAGFGCALAALWLSHRMDLIDHEGHAIHLGWRTLLYWPWLIKEIIKSACDVTRVTLHPRLPISPTLVRFRPSQRTDLGLVIHANSITLTPGTISMQVGREEFLVHALTAAGARSMTAGEMDRRVTVFEAGE